jgi:hypothetical protein
MKRIKLIPVFNFKKPCSTSYRIQDNVFGKARGRKPYGHTATTDNAAQKHYLGFYISADGSLPQYQDVAFSCIQVVLDDDLYTNGNGSC